jgi:aldehyde dehydrogenase (NAD+)
VEAAVRGVFYLSGQACFAHSRIYVHSSIAKEFVAEFQEASLKFPTGDPFGGGVMNGPLVDKIQFDKVMNYIDEGNSVAGRTLAGGGRLGDKGYYVKPTAYLDVDENSRIVKEEIFGPVVIINTFTDEEDAIAKANPTEYGLSAAVYTKDLYRYASPATIN